MSNLEKEFTLDQIAEIRNKYQRTQSFLRSRRYVDVTVMTADMGSIEAELMYEKREG